MGLREEFRSNYVSMRERRGRCDAAVRALNWMLCERSRVWSEMNFAYMMGRGAGDGRWRALWGVGEMYWKPAPLDHLALARAAVERRDWNTAAAELRLWGVWDWEKNAEEQRRERLDAAAALERGDLVAARDHCRQAMMLMGWGDGDLLIQLLTREIEGHAKI